MESDHRVEKTHPIAGYIFGIVLAGVLVALMGMFNGNDKAILLVPIFLGWAVVSLVIFGAVKHADAGH
ncbi:MAG: hypothetical protein ACKOE2_09195 [Actinomycetales bacterium]